MSAEAATVNGSYRPEADVASGWFFLIEKSCELFTNGVQCSSLENVFFCHDPLSKSLLYSAR